MCMHTLGPYKDNWGWLEEPLQLLFLDIPPGAPMEEEASCEICDSPYRGHHKLHPLLFQTAHPKYIDIWGEPHEPTTNDPLST